MINIGVSASFIQPDINRDVFGPKRLAYLEGDMARYVCQNDVIVCLIQDCLVFDANPIEI